MKIYVIHVYRRRWEFYPKEIVHEATVSEDEVPKTGWLHWLQKNAVELWQSIGDARTGIRGQLRKIVQKLNSRVDPTEPMLRMLRSAPTIEIIYPSDINPRFVRKRLRLLLLSKMARHRRGIWINGVLLPFSIAAVVLPGPNIFFYWIAYRLLANILASRGAQRVLSSEVELVFSPSTKLNELVTPERRLSEPLDLSSAEQIAHHFDLPELIDYLRLTSALAEEKIP